ncbi:hypothetical protein QAD02_020602 [Eretmocerus hayati]|uniref:Uncharacterized protein n=1 Tax=Eretmocerus hayati TaxID=131215 RepID=A0ACC2PND0_9HYME|nr:hypothetical protein QAD02_020602 [Eretmocerus hayati]
MSGAKQIFLWKGVRVSEKIFKDRQRRAQLAEKIRGSNGRFRADNLKECEEPVTASTSKAENDQQILTADAISSTDPINCGKIVDSDVNEEPHDPSSQETADIMDGRRLVHWKVLGSQMFCYSCKSILAMDDVTDEARKGLASVLLIKCRSCGKVTRVVTDREHKVSSGRYHFDSNTKVALGMINGGMGMTHVNKILTSVDVPELRWNTYRAHEKEVSRGLEMSAEEVRIAAAYEERRATIENAEKLLELLPPGLDLTFIFPDLSEDDIKNRRIRMTAIIRFAGSFDMGWFTRGSSRSYDSLSGTGTLIRYFTRKVVGYVVLNRKCNMCDHGHPKEDDCRLNFVGSAKAMEPEAAVISSKDNSILQKRNLELGIVIADNDSSSKCAMREVLGHQIVKQSDKNHTSKGVLSGLFDLKKRKKYKELTNAAIEYLRKNFNYCVSQNRGNAKEMALAIKNIPYHCFNDHSSCGSWCGYKSDPENYRHKVIGEGFYDGNLFIDLKEYFNGISEKTHQFSAGASSNSNESTNGQVVSKAPKSRVYGTSFSGDARVACAISRKNIGEIFTADVAKKSTLSPGRHSLRYSSKVDKHHLRRKIKASTRAFKLSRILLKKAKRALRHKNETNEGVTYESDVGLLTNLLDTVPVRPVRDNLMPIVIYFDLETGGLPRTSDILQIAAM